MADQRILKHHQASKGRRKIPIAAIGDKNKKHVTFSKRRLGLFKKASELCVLCGADLAIITFSEVGKVFCFGHPTAESVIQRYTGGGGGGGTSCRLIPSSSSSSSSSSISLAASPATTPSHLPPAPAVLMLLDQHQAPQPDCNIIKINNQIRSMKDDQAGTAAAGIVMNKYIEDYERVKKRIEQEKKNSPSSYADYNINSTTPPASCSSNEFWWEEPVDELDLPELEQLMASLQDLRNNVARKAEELSMHVLIREHVGHINDIADHPRHLHHRIINSGIMVDQSTAPVQDPLANFDMFNSESGFGGSGFTFA